MSDSLADLEARRTAVQLHGSPPGPERQARTVRRDSTVPMRLFAFFLTTR